MRYSGQFAVVRQNLRRNFCRLAEFLDGLRLVFRACVIKIFFVIAQSVRAFLLRQNRKRTPQSGSAVLGDLVVASVAARIGLIVGGQAAVLHQPPKYRIQRRFGNIQYLLYVLRDTVAVGALSLDYGKHDAVQQGGRDGIGHMESSSPVFLIILYGI